MPTDDATAATYLHGDRLAWADAPTEVATWVAERLGGPVTSWSDRRGGMSVGIAAVVGAGGRRAFVKALDGDHNPAGLGLYRQEAAVAHRLPRSPHIPALIADAELATSTGPWAVTLFEAVDARPPEHPWRAADLRRVLDAWGEVAPLLHASTWRPRSAELGDFLGRWRTVADDPDDPWYDLLTDSHRGRRWVDRLAAMCAEVDGTPPDSPAGPGTEVAVLSHIDLRADNVLLSDDPDDPIAAWVVDWAHPGLAAPWADTAILLADVIGSGADVGDGGPIDVVDVWRTHPATAGFDVERLLTVTTALGVACHVGSHRPPNPLFPHQRGWERALADGITGFVHRHR